MKAEIIAVGTEILLGQIVNTNATFLSEELASLGIEVYYQTVVGDNAQRLTQLLKIAQKRSDLIILCGGLGPTEDDLTKETIANYLHKSLIEDQDGLRNLQHFFELSKRKMTKNNLRQILTIKDGYTLQNPTGLAVGTLIENDKTNYLLLPGPPNELQPMFQQFARPLLEKLFPQREQLFSKVLRFYGIGESQLVTELKELIYQQTNPTIAPYAKTNEVTLRLTAKATDEKTSNKMLLSLEKQIMEKVGSYFYGYGENNSLAKVVAHLLKEKQKTITAAESLTSGLFQSTLGEISGISQIFKGGFVVYTEETKENFLNIPKELLENDGTVSEICAIKMAEHARQLANTDYAISFTGVAEKTLEGKPAGTVWIGFSQKNQTAFARSFQFNGDRNSVRQHAVMQGLALIRQIVLNKE